MQPLHLNFVLFWLYFFFFFFTSFKPKFPRKLVRAGVGELLFTANDCLCMGRVDVLYCVCVCVSVCVCESVCVFSHSVMSNFPWPYGL